MKARPELTKGKQQVRDALRKKSQSWPGTKYPWVTFYCEKCEANRTARPNADGTKTCLTCEKREGRMNAVRIPEE